MLLALLVLAVSAPAIAQNAFDVNALMKLARVTDPQVSPDATLVAFTVQTVDLPGNQKPSHIYVVPVSGGEPKRLTSAGTRNERPRWSPDSRQLAFISDRSGSAQVWVMARDGANPRQVTSLATEAGGVLWSPDGKNLLLTSEVFPDCPDNACNQRRLEAEKNSKLRARIYTGLLYRHWTRWQSKQRSHLLVVSAAGGEPRDLTPGQSDVPPFSLEGPDDYAFSPDGQEVCFAMNVDADPAASTNSDLYVVSINGGEPKKITSNPAADNSPRYSPDGRYLAWRAQVRPGYESDRWRLMVLERATGKVTNLTDNIDRWVTGFAWTPDSSKLFFTVEDRGRANLQMIPAGGGGASSIISGDAYIDDLQMTPDGRTLIFTQHTASRPPEIYAAPSGGESVPLTHFNDALLASARLPALEEFWVERGEGARVHSFLLKPAGFQPGQRYPVLFLIHGGPQGAWGESWSYRWNAQVLAGAGYVVVMPNPTGSTGYGQKFIDDINQDWGGRPYQDILAVVDYVEKLPYVDASRMAAAGASYGGYMIDWMLGHTTRFKALVSHAGVFDLRTEFGETEELWFPLWEFGGPPWDKPEVYAQWSPSQYARDFRTPTLVTGGELDFRVPYGQDLQLFTALQLQKVPSKLVIFPDEGHWILKPQNSVLWYETVLDWVSQWLEKPWTPPPAQPAQPEGAPTQPAPAPPAKP
ncbi:MAG: S9 family peptidase [Bryobacteraceae bacterium]